MAMRFRVGGRCPQSQWTGCSVRRASPCIGHFPFHSTARTLQGRKAAIPRFAWQWPTWPRWMASQPTHDEAMGATTSLVRVAGAGSSRTVAPRQSHANAKGISAPPSAYPMDNNGTRKPYNIRAEEIVQEEYRKLLQEKSLEEVTKLPTRLSTKDGEIVGPEFGLFLRQKILNDAVFLECLPSNFAPTYGWWCHRFRAGASAAGIGRKLPDKNGDMDAPLHFMKGRKEYAGAANAASEKGLYMEFAKEYEHAMAIMCAVLHGPGSDDIVGHWERMDRDEAKSYASRHIEAELTRLLHHPDVVADGRTKSVSDILGGWNVDDLYDVDLAVLEAMAREFAAPMATPHADSEGSYDPRHEEHIGNLVFASLCNIAVVQNDIVNALSQRISGVLARADGTLCFPTRVGQALPQNRSLAVLQAEHCVGGGTVRHGRDPNAYKQQWYFEPSYVVDQFGTALYDLNAQKDWKGGKDDRYRTTPLLDTGRLVRRIPVTSEQRDGVHIAKWKLRDPTRKRGKVTRKVYRLLQVNASNHGLGMTNSTRVQAYLGRRGKTWEEAFPYQAITEEQYQRRLAKKQWENVAFATHCDVDHLVGRREEWMNAVLFTWHTSHRYNQCMAHVRKRAGHWCFGLSYKPYYGGN